MCCKIEIHNTHDFYFILLSAWEYFPLGSYGCDVYAEYLNFSVQRCSYLALSFAPMRYPSNACHTRMMCILHTFEVVISDI